MINDPISVRWLDSQGCGSGVLALQLAPFPADPDSKNPVSLDLIVRGGSPAIGAVFLVDGRFNLQIDQVAELYCQLGGWLEAQGAGAVIDAGRPTAFGGYE